MNLSPTNKNRKGVGYMIESIIAVLTIFIFAFGQSPAEPAQDWSQFQKEITANDLGYTLKKTGDITPLLQRHETGSLQTAVSTITNEKVQVSGTVENLPLNDAVIGFSVTNRGDNQRHKDDIRSVQSGDECDGDLEEIDEQPGTDVMRIDDASKHDNIILYFADTDPEISSGFDDTAGDYDTMWVDNGTKCQFSSSEGPKYLDEFYRWEDEEYYDLKNISSDDFTYHNATLPFNLQKELNTPMNGIKTAQSTDTFLLADTDISTYDMVVLQREEVIEHINDADQADELETFMRRKPVLILANLSESNVRTGFIQETGLKWVDLSPSSTPDNPSFSESPESGEIESYFEGVNGDLSDVSLPAGGTLSSSNGETLTDENSLLYSQSGNYNTDPWNISDHSMLPVAPENVDGEPDSKCLPPADQQSDNLTEGTFDFPGPGSEYDVINTELGSSDTFCQNNDVRALNIDLNQNNEFDDEGEGPLLQGENIVVDNRNYTININSNESAEFVYSGNDNVELINYRTGFEGFKGDKMARIGYEEQYSAEDKRMIVATIYWLLGDSTTFGSGESSSASTTVLGSIDQNVYMPYRLSMRWH